LHAEPFAARAQAPVLAIRGDYQLKLEWTDDNALVITAPEPISPTQVFARLRQWRDVRIEFRARNRQDPS
jgi:hypothetical protein